VLPFEYVLIKDLRDQGIDAAEVPDPLATELIQLASDRLNLHSGRWFVPVPMVAELDGRDSPTIFLPGFIPFIEVTSAKISSERSIGRTNLGCVSILPDKRVFGNLERDDVEISRDAFLLEIVSRAAGVVNAAGILIGEKELHFPRGRRNIKIDGVFGAITERTGGKFETETTATASEGDEVVTVTDVSGFRKNDVAVFILAEGAEVQIVVDVDKGANQLKFTTPDSLKFDVPSGTKVRTYGRVPLQIKRCTLRLANHNRKLLGSIDAEADDIEKFIISEKTDNYEYKLDPDAVAGLESGSTGDAECDRVLDLFTPPPYIGFV